MLHHLILTRQVSSNHCIFCDCSGCVWSYNKFMYFNLVDDDLFDNYFYKVKLQMVFLDIIISDCLNKTAISTL